MFLKAQHVKKCKKALGLYKKTLTHKLIFWSLQKVVQVADGKGFRKPYKTFLKLIIWMFCEAQNVKIFKKALYVCKKWLAHKSSFWSFQKVVQVADYKGFKKPYKTYLEFIILLF